LISSLVFVFLRSRVFHFKSYLYLYEFLSAFQAFSAFQGLPHLFFYHPVFSTKTRQRESNRQTLFPDLFADVANFVFTDLPMKPAIAVSLLPLPSLPPLLPRPPVLSIEI